MHKSPMHTVLVWLPPPHPRASTTPAVSAGLASGKPLWRHVGTETRSKNAQNHDEGFGSDLFSPSSSTRRFLLLLWSMIGFLLSVVRESSSRSSFAGVGQAYIECQPRSRDKPKVDKV